MIGLPQTSLGAGSGQVPPFMLGERSVIRRGDKKLLVGRLESASDALGAPIRAKVPRRFKHRSSHYRRHRKLILTVLEACEGQFRHPKPVRSMGAVSPDADISEKMRRGLSGAKIRHPAWPILSLRQKAPEIFASSH